MPKNRSALRAGLLLLVSVLLILGVVVGIKGLSWLSDRSVNFMVAFELRTNIGGLRVGDEVRIGGFKVGEVKDIILREDKDPKHPPYYILIVFSVPQKYSIRKDAEIRIDGTLTGTSWLNFESLGRGDPLPPGQPLIGKGSPTTELLAKVQGLEPRLNSILKQMDETTLPGLNGTLADVRGKTVPMVNNTLDKLGQTADSFKATGDNAAALTRDMRESYKPAIDHYHRVADKAIEMLEAIRALFGDTTPDFRTTVANLRTSTDKLPAMLDKVDGMLTKLDTAMDGVNKSLVEVHAAIVNTKELTGTAKDLIAGNKSKLDSMIDSVKKAGDNLKAATAEIRRSPWRLLYKPAPNEMGNLNLYDAARQFAEGANDLSDAAGALRDAIKSGKQDPEELKRLMDQIDKSFSNFQGVEKTLWEKVKE
jgi:ABC-type transporter Mla subunit MlaD